MLAALQHVPLAFPEYLSAVPNSNVHDKNTGHAGDYPFRCAHARRKKPRHIILPHQPAAKNTPAALAFCSRAGPFLDAGLAWTTA
eukprot:2995743-Prymnesium_polylepis.1